MSGLNVVNNAEATPDQRQRLDAIRSQIGMVPSFLRVLATSPVALRAFLRRHTVSSVGLLDR